MGIAPLGARASAGIVLINYLNCILKRQRIFRKEYCCFPHMHTKSVNNLFLREILGVIALIATKTSPGLFACVSSHMIMFTSDIPFAEKGSYIMYYNISNIYGVGTRGNKR